MAAPNLSPDPGRSATAPEVPTPAWGDFARRLRAYVGRRVDAAAVDDVVGDILLRLVRHRAELATADAPVAWMLRVAANAIADHYRRRAAEERALARMANELGGTSGPPAPAGSAAEELAGCLRPMIQDLPERYSQALLLSEMEGLSQGVAARHLGISTSAMKSRVRRGRAKLKQALLRCCAVELDRRGHVMAYRPRRRACGERC